MLPFLEINITQKLIPIEIHVWYIYLWYIYLHFTIKNQPFHVGKMYQSPMDP